MDQTSRIFIAGHRRLVGSAIRRNLEGRGFQNLILRTRGELDLCNGVSADEFFAREKPERELAFSAGGHEFHFARASSRPTPGI